MFDGFGFVPQRSSETVEVEGFVTPASGPFDTRVGFLVYESDAGAAPTFLLVDGEQVIDPSTEDPDDLLNSAIVDLDGPVTTRTPAYPNQFGFDLKRLALPGILDNGATGAELTLANTRPGESCPVGRCQDIFYPGAFTFTTDLQAPRLEIAKAVTPVGDVTPGATLTYTVTVTNAGADAAVDVELTDDLPDTVTLVAGSPASDCGATFSEGATLTADLGRLAPAATCVVAFEVIVDPSAAPGTTIVNVASVTGDAETVPGLPPFTATSPPVETGVAAPDPTPTPTPGPVPPPPDPTFPPQPPPPTEPPDPIREGFADGAPAVVLARADVYADALAGAPLAAQVEGPILLTETDRLTPITANEIDRLGADRVVLLGGEVALADQVRADVEARGLQVGRVRGPNRFATAAAVADALGPQAPVAYMAEGGNADPARGWPDALTASARAAAEGRPILLVTQQVLPEETRAALDTQQVTESVIVGDTGAIGEEVEAGVADLVDEVRRLAGQTRYETGAEVYRDGLDGGLDPSQVWLATGADWPDALSSGPVIGLRDQGLLLVDPADLDASPPTRDLLAAQRRSWSGC